MIWLVFGGMRHLETKSIDDWMFVNAEYYKRQTYSNLQGIDTESPKCMVWLAAVWFG
jgi:hypothetical protein